MLQSPISPEPRQVPHLRVIQAEDDVPDDTGALPREWRPMMPPELYAPDVGPDGIAVYGVLCLHVDGMTGECWPSQETVGKRIGVSRKRVSAAIDLLIDKGLVELVRDHGFTGSRKYRLPDQIHADLNVPKRNNQPSLIVPKRHIEMFQNGTSESAESAHEPYVSEPNDIEPEGDTPLTPRPDFPEAMLAFWDDYDAKGRERSSRSQVLAEWKRIKPNAATVAEIMAGVEAWNASQSFRDGYAPGAHRFLKLRKWTERPAERSPAPQQPGAASYHDLIDQGIAKAKAKMNGTVPHADVIDTTGRIIR